MKKYNANRAANRNLVQSAEKGSEETVQNPAGVAELDERMLGMIGGASGPTGGCGTRHGGGSPTFCYACNL